MWEGDMPPVVQSKHGQNGEVSLGAQAPLRLYNKKIIQPTL